MEKRQDLPRLWELCTPSLEEVCDRWGGKGLRRPVRQQFLLKSISVSDDFQTSGAWDVGFEAKAGEVTVILGRNGVGKTTLLKSLMGVIPIRTGTIALDGAPIQHLRLESPAGSIRWMVETWPRIAKAFCLRRRSQPPAIANAATTASQPSIDG